jgi:hypothetical protein
MESDRPPMKPVVFADSSGIQLVALPADGVRKDRWQAWKVGTDGVVHGPDLLGNFLRFSPSDYGESDGPHPPDVLALLTRISRARPNSPAGH